MSSDQVRPANSELHRRTAATCNDAAWNLIERSCLDAAGLTQLLTAAATARHHWREIGTPTNVAHADLLLAWAMARAGAGQPAMQLAGEAFSHFEAHGATWERAFAHAAMAMACSAAGDADGLRRHRGEAARLGAELAGGDAAYFQAAFKTVPGAIGTELSD